MDVIYRNYSEIRDKLGYTDYKIAKETGIGTATLSNWKNGKYTPKQDKLQKIADFLNVSLDYLVNGQEADENSLTAKDEKDIAKDMENIIRKLRNKEDGPASFDGGEINEDDIELFAGQLELMLKKLKTINKEKYNPYKNKK